jgi:Sec-independent protein translocase protein TatA
MAANDGRRPAMFGFGHLEIILLALLVVLIFGAERSGRIFRRGYDAYRGVNRARKDLKSTFSLRGLLRRDGE